MKLFERVNMASNDVQSYVRSGRFYDGDETAPVNDGAVVVVGDLEPHEVYQNTKDLNTFKLTAPKAVTDRVCLVDYVGVSSADVVGVKYRVGDSLTC